MMTNNLTTNELKALLATAELVADAERERARACDERNAQLSARLRDVSAQLEEAQAKVKARKVLKAVFTKDEDDIWHVAADFYDYAYFNRVQAALVAEASRVGLLPEGDIS
jgi:multidrug efflux pump subunit AcrA (membrane-fusion protein)